MLTQCWQGMGSRGNRLIDRVMRQREQPVGRQHAVGLKTNTATVSIAAVLTAMASLFAEFTTVMLGCVAVML